jgi:nitric oxide reductase subunit C
MSNTFARNLFVFGSLFCFVVLIILTIDTMSRMDSRAPVITEGVDKGKKVWHKYDCIGCHTIFGNGSYFAPDMTKVTKKKPKEYLKKFILDPRSIKPDAAMPKLGLTGAEADNLMVFLDWISEVDTNDWPPEPILAATYAGKDASAGQVLFQKHDCVACHQIKSIGGAAGPDLTHVGGTRPAVEWHIAHLKDPESMVPDSAMPEFDHLSDEELRELAEYLVTLK